jgi:hypothetical protein
MNKAEKFRNSLTLNGNGGFENLIKYVLNYNFYNNLLTLKID